MDEASASSTRRSTSSRSRIRPRPRHPSTWRTRRPLKRRRPSDRIAQGAMNRVLVTGGAGFIGSHVAEAFLQAGWTVEIIDDLSSGRRGNLPAAARFHEDDIGSEQARAIIVNGKFDAICHLAAQIDVRRSVADPIRDGRINVLGTLNLLEAVRESHRATRFIASSTGGAIYGDFVEPPSVEDAAKDPVAPYGVSKL